MLNTSEISTTSQIRDLRLRGMSEILDITHRGMALTLDEAPQFDEWSKKVSENMLYGEGAHRGIKSLRGTGSLIFVSVSSDHFFKCSLVVVNQEQFHCEALELLCCTGRLLVLHHALSFVRASAAMMDKQWVYTKHHKDLNTPIVWGSDALSAAEATLTIFCSLSERDRRCLSAAPDVIFTVTTLAAAFVFVVKFRSLLDFGIKIGGVNNELLRVVVNRMSDAALHAEHAPAKYAKLIAAWTKKWDDAARNYDTNAASAPVTSDSQALTDLEASNSFTSPEFYLDDNFWSAFMNTFSNPSGGKLLLPVVRSIRRLLASNYSGF